MSDRIKGVSRRVASAMLAATLIGGLATGAASAAPAAAVDPPAPPPEGKALIYVFRQMDAYWTTQAYISVDGAKVASIKGLQYSWFYAPAGSHELKLSWPLWPGPVKGVVTWDAGRTYFYKAMAELGYGRSGSRWGIGQVDAAAQALSMLDYRPSFGADKLTTSSGDPNDPANRTAP